MGDLTTVAERLIFSAPPNLTQLFDYSDSRIKVLGRALDSGTGRNVIWGGTQFVFKVSGMTQLNLHANVVDANTTDQCAFTYAIDNNPDIRPTLFGTTVAQIFSGALVLPIPIPDTGEHTVIIGTGMYYAGVWAQTAKIELSGISFAYGGSISAWAQGARRLQIVSDSWGAASADWPRLMDRSLWELYSISHGGSTCAQADSNYNYDYSGHIAGTDPAASIAIISFGVNDFNASITNAAFEASLYSLLDKIRTRQPSTPIVMVRVPKNLTTGKDFGKYGVNMANVAAARSNAYYYDTSALDASFTWYTDGYHGDAAGKQLLANGVDAFIAANGL